MKKTAVIFSSVLAIAVLTILILASCGSKKAEPVTVSPVSSPAPVPTVSPTPTATEIPIVISTPTPELGEDPVPKPSVTPAPTPTATVKPSPTPTPQLPVITKSPTDETVDEGGSCYFVAKYENALIAVWHFVSPDGQTDLTYEAAQKKFTTMEIINGMYSTMQLKNIPYAANGWRVYCRYSNSNGYSDTKTALITVRENPNPTPTPTADPSPTTDPAPLVTGFSGTWEEEVAHRGKVTITQTASGTYAIAAEWSESAFAGYFWTMEATENGNGTLAYTNAVLEVRTYNDDGTYTTETKYTDGSGSFQLDSNAKLLWTDMMGDVNPDYRFVLVG